MIKTYPLPDWQPESDATLNINVSFEPAMILLSEIHSDNSSGRLIGVELQDGVLRVHCYDGQNEEPLSVAIHEDTITTTTG